MSLCIYSTQKNVIWCLDKIFFDNMRHYYDNPKVKKIEVRSTSAPEKNFCFWYDLKIILLQDLLKHRHTFLAQWRLDPLVHWCVVKKGPVSDFAAGHLTLSFIFVWNRKFSHASFSVNLQTFASCKTMSRQRVKYRNSSKLSPNQNENRSFMKEYTIFMKTHSYRTYLNN